MPFLITVDVIYNGRCLSLKQSMPLITVDDISCTYSYTIHASLLADSRSTIHHCRALPIVVLSMVLFVKMPYYGNCDLLTLHFDCVVNVILCSTLTSVYECDLRVGQNCNAVHLVQHHVLHR